MSAKWMLCALAVVTFATPANADTDYAPTIPGVYVQQVCEPTGDRAYCQVYFTHRAECNYFAARYLPYVNITRRCDPDDDGEGLYVIDYDAPL